MKKIIIIALLLILAGFNINADTKNDEYAFIKTAEQAIQSTVKVGILNHGSGFYISENEIITNSHVVKDAREITFRTSDGRRCTATLVYREDSPDLALFETECKGTPLALTESYSIGQTVIAVGNPDVYDFTVTRGIVSGEKWGMIQTDARVSTGSSGGALVDVEGKVIGVIKAQDKAFDYISFAISGKTVKRFLKRARN